MAQDVGITASTPRGLTEGQERLLWLDRSGAAVVIDFYAKAILDGYGWQARAGTISVPLVGDVAITDTAAEIAIDIANGGTLIPVYQSIGVNLAGGTLHEYATKSVAAASSAGNAFVLLPLKTNASSTGLATARVDAAGGVTVTAEVVTTTRLHWSYGNAVAVAAGGAQPVIEWAPLRPPVLVGNATAPECLYTQIAATTTGPSYFANLDALVIPSALMGN